MITVKPKQYSVESLHSAIPTLQTTPNLTISIHMDSILWQALWDSVHCQTESGWSRISTCPFDTMLWPRILMLCRDVVQPWGVSYYEVPAMKNEKSVGGWCATSRITQYTPWAVCNLNINEHRIYMLQIQPHIPGMEYLEREMNSGRSWSPGLLVWKYKSYLYTPNEGSWNVYNWIYSWESFSFWRLAEFM